MDKKIEFTEETRDAIITEQEGLGFRLYEEQRYFEGWWLLFTDEDYIEPEPPRDLAAEIDEMKAKMVVSEPVGDEIKVTNLVYDPTTKEVKYKEAV